MIGLDLNLLKMRKVVAFPLLLSLSFSLLLMLLLLPLSEASIHHRPWSSSKAQDGVVTMELWCVAKNNAEDAALQSAIDWACGPGGADCSPIQQGGPCYDPSDVENTASYAFNDYYLKHGMTDDSCYFDNTAALTSLNPSHDNCKFPSGKTVSNGSISNPTTALGLGTNKDTSGCDTVAQPLFWPLLTIILLITHTLFLSVPDWILIVNSKRKAKAFSFNDF